MNLENVTRDDWIVGGLALVLAIGLIVFPWFDISVTVGAFSASATYSATSAPDGWLGILAFIAALAIVADLAIERLSPQTQIPAIGGSRTNTRFVLALVTAAFVALKFLFHIHFSLFGWGFYVNVILTAALVWVAYQAHTQGSIGIPGGGGAARPRPTPSGGSPGPGSGARGTPPPPSTPAPPPSAPPAGGGSAPPAEGSAPPAEGSAPRAGRSAPAAGGGSTPPPSPQL